MRNIFSRYFGKVCSVIKKDGFWGGIKTIFSAAFVMLHPVGKGDILFVSSGVVGDSAMYRVSNVAEELRFKGFKCSITVQENPFLASCADKFQIFIFHRVQKTPTVLRLMERIKAQGKEIIFETDDLVFDHELLKKQDFYENSNNAERKFYDEMSQDGVLNDPYVKTCTTTTNFLAEKLKEHCKDVFVVPNKLSKKDLKIAEKILMIKEKNSFHSGLDPESRVLDSSICEDNKVVRIGYFSGTHSHDKDFSTVTDALMQIMEKHGNVELFLVGPLDVESRLSKFSERVRQFPYAKREKHFENVASVDINIAPLEIENPFCQAKSELKFFEAGILNVPTVAAATDPFVRAIENEIDGFVVEGTEQWAEKLEKLIVDENLRKSMGQKAHEKALARYSTINADNEEYYEYLRNKLIK